MTCPPLIRLDGCTVPCCTLCPQPRSIVSYNHLGNNDGKNLSAPQQFRSKEISKSNVVDDTVQANPVLYGPQDKPDHCVSELWGGGGWFRGGVWC